MLKLIEKLFAKIYPLVEWISDVHLPFTRKRVTGKEYYLWRNNIRPGDVFLTSTYGELSNIINPSEFKHGAIYCGRDDDGICWVYEATKKGVYHIDLVTFLTTKDRVVMLRHRDITQKSINIFREFFKQVKGLPYDDQFSTGNKKYYCFELLAKALETGIPHYTAKLHSVFGKKVYTSKTFETDEFEKIIDH